MPERSSWLALCLLLLGAATAEAAATNRVAEIRARGTLTCGVWPHVPGFAVERDGRFVGFEADLCRAIAAAILGDPGKVRFVELAHVSQFGASTQIDLAVRRLTWTPGREQANGVVFGPVVFYDGQGFMTPRASGIREPVQLTGQRVCVLNMERHPQTLHTYFRDSGREIRMVLVEGDRQAEEALRDDRCRAYSADVSWLAAARSTFANGLSQYEILEEQISKEPLAPLMRAEDAELVRVVRWTIYAMIEAEELGLDSRNVGAVGAVGAGASRARAFLAVHPGVGVAPEPGEWVRAIIAGAGNYGELYHRNLGAGSPIQLERGLNRLWSRGGLLYAPPLER